MKTSHIIRHFKAVVGVYASRGFRVHVIIADNQFESMCGDIADLHAVLHVTARDEHAPEIERFQRTIKERVRAQHSVLPFNRYHGNAVHVRPYDLPRANRKIQY